MSSFTITEASFSALAAWVVHVPAVATWNGSVLADNANATSAIHAIKELNHAHFDTAMPFVVRFRAKIAGTPHYCYVVNTGATMAAWWNLSTGATSNIAWPGATYAIAPDGDSYVCTLNAPSATGLTGWLLGLTTVNNNFPYVSVNDGSLTITSAVLYQPRAAAWVDLVAGYSMANATEASQPPIQKADGTSPGGNTFAGKSAVCQSGDVAKTLSCATAGLLTMLTSAAAVTFWWRGARLATPTANVPLLSIGGTGTFSCGIDTANKPYMTVGSTTVTCASAINTAQHDVSYELDASANASIYVDGVLDAGPTACTPGTITPTSVIYTERCSATRCKALIGRALTATERTNRIAYLGTL